MIGGVREQAITNVCIIKAPAEAGARNKKNGY